MNHRAATLSVVLVAPLLGACAGGPFATTEAAPVTAAAPAPAPTDPILDFLSTAPDGTARALVDPQTGGVTEVTAGDTYFAASGRHCRRYTTLTRPLPRQDRLACRDAAGGWLNVPMLVNPALPDADGS